MSLRVKSHKNLPAMCVFTVRLPYGLVERLKKNAENARLPMTTYLRVLLTEAIGFRSEDDTPPESGAVPMVCDDGPVPRRRGRRGESVLSSRP